MSDAEGDERPNKRLKRDPVDDDDGSDDDGSGDEKGSKGGSSCHQCKSRRNFGALTYCTSNLDKKNKRCRKKFCGHCLKKFYKESAQAAAGQKDWKCPSCRKICCCAACRRRKTKEVGHSESPVHQPKPKKPSTSHKKERVNRDDDDTPRHSTGRSERRGAGTHGKSGRQARRHDDDDDDGVYGGHGADEGYPPSSSHRRGDRSLLHSSTHSPRLGSRMSDSPMRSGMQGGNYDMMDSNHGNGDGDEYSSDDQQHSYSDSDGGDHDQSHDDDQQSDAVSEDPGGPPNTIHTGGASSYMHDDDPSASLPSSQFTALLSQHIKSLAEESARNANSPFAKLYKQAQAVKVKKKIKAILLRADIKKEKKVELIAALLAPLEEGANGSPESQPAASSSAGQMVMAQ